MATQASIKEHVTCPVCLGIYRHPRSLSCQHPLCEECAGCLPVITRHESGTTTRLVKCPTCREETVLPRGTAANLPPAFQTNTLIELYEAANALPDATPPPATARQPPSDYRKCPEHQRDIELYCEQCKMRICTACMLRDHSSHKCGMLTDLSVKNREDVKARLRELQHQVGVVQNALTSIDSREESIKQRVVTVKEEIDVLVEELIERLRCSGRRLKVSVDTLSREQLAALLPVREEGQMVLVQLQSCAGYVDRTLKAETDLCDERTELMERMSDVCALVHTNKIMATSNSEVITLLPNTVLLDNCSVLGEVTMAAGPLVTSWIAKKVATTPTQAPPMKTTSMETRPIEAPPTQAPPKETLPTQTKVTPLEKTPPTQLADAPPTQETPPMQPTKAPPTQSEVANPVKTLDKPVSASASGRGFLFSVVNMQSQVQIKLLTTVDGIVSGYLCLKDARQAPSYRVECTVKEVAEGKSIFGFFGSRSPKSYDISYCPAMSGPHELKVEVGGVTIPVDPCTISVQPSLDMRISQLKAFVEGLSKPHSIAVTDDNQIVYSDRYLGNKWSVMICDASGNRIRKFDLDELNIGGDSLPLAVTHDDHIILVDTEGCAIKKVTMKGVIVKYRTFSSAELFRPQSVAVDAGNRVYISNATNVIKLSPDLAKILYTYQFHAYGCFTLAGICMLRCVDVQDKPQELLLVSNSFGNCVLKVNHSGKVVGKQLPVSSPKHIAIDRSTSLVYIVGKTGKNLVMFDREGELLESVSSDSTIFEAPTGMAVGPDGTVYVCTRGTIVTF